MLRARKKDARIKPNRKLDKRSSRGMLYENEELRLRTIEINAEVERGQTDIKKLRRENDHLRREMWALRDEYERLEKLIKHLDLAGTGSENSQRGHQHSDGEGGGGRRGSSRGGDDDDGASLNGIEEDSADDEIAAEKHRHRLHHGDRCTSEPATTFAMRSKSQSSVLPGSMAPAAAASSSSSVHVSSPTDPCKCHHLHHGLYVDCTNPDKDNIENYQKAYGRMPGTSAKTYISTQHFHPTVVTTNTSSPASISRGCYESLGGLKDRYSIGSGMEDEDGYAACSHPAGLSIRNQLPPIPTMGGGVMPPPPSDSPPPLPPPLRRGVGGLEVQPEEPEVSSTGSEEEETVSCGDGGIHPDTPSEDDCHFNLDHLVDVVRSFQQERDRHHSGLVVATCHPVAESPTPVVIEEASNEEEDDKDPAADIRSIDSSSSSNSGKPEASGMTTIKRRPLPLPQQNQRHRQVAIIEREPVGVLSGLSELNASGPFGANAGRGLIPLRRNSFSSTSSSSSPSGSPTTGTTVVFLNNNNNNKSLNNNKSGSASQLNVLRGDGKSIRSNKGSSPIRIAALPAPPSSSSAGDALDQQQEYQSGCLSLYPLPDGDASASLLRLHAVDPHTVSFDLSKAMDSLGDLLPSLTNPPVTVQEVIDQMDRQLNPTLRSHVRGVRCVLAGGTLFFISLDSARSVRKLMREPFTLRGHRIRLTDVSAQTWIVALSGVPHYISDATVGLLLAAFGTIIGDVERRFFRGLDTGERLVRFRLKGHNTKLPRHITVGGCRIQVRRMSPSPQQSVGSAASSKGGDGTSVRSRSVSNPSGMDRRISLEPEVVVASAEVMLPSGKVAEVYQTGSKATTAAVAGATASSSSPSAASGPKIGRSFEYRSQLRVDLRMSAEVPVPPPSTTDDSPVPGTSTRITPPGSCPVCEQSNVIIHPPGGVTAPVSGGSKPSQTPPPPPLPPPSLVVHRCRHHHVPEPGSNCATPSSATIPLPATTLLRESPPKSRASVNFEDSIIAGGSGTGNRTTGKSRSPAGTSSTVTCNGILRKSASGEDAAAVAAAVASSEAAGPSDAAPPPPADANGLKGVKSGVKKTARSFSLVDTFRVSRERRGQNAASKPVVRVETVVEAANPNAATSEVVTTTAPIQRRDSAESSSRSSRSSRKSNELPWCGCWGNGCL